MGEREPWEKSETNPKNGSDVGRLSNIPAPPPHEVCQLFEGKRERRAVEEAPESESQLSPRSVSRVSNDSKLSWNILGPRVAAEESGCCAQQLCELPAGS